MTGCPGCGLFSAVLDELVEAYKEQAKGLGWWSGYLTH